MSRVELKRVTVGIGYPVATGGWVDGVALEPLLPQKKSELFSPQKKEKPS
ncbi:MAG: hypothetical protein QXV73_03935 [Candidatus Micrarchaeia archaeon]